MWRLWTCALAFAFAWAASALWRRWRDRRWGLPVTLTVRADCAEPETVAGYFAEIAVRLDERPERMRIVCEAPAGVAFDLKPDGRLAIRDARREHVFSLRDRWIAEHPVPLELDGAVLYVEPTDSGRFRVALSPDGFRPRPGCRVALAAAAAAAGVLAVAHLVPEPLAAVGGVFAARLPKASKTRRGS